MPHYNICINSKVISVTREICRIVKNTYVKYVCSKLKDDSAFLSYITKKYNVLVPPTG
jgi:hypothetical protein